MKFEVFPAPSEKVFYSFQWEFFFSSSEKLSWLSARSFLRNQSSFSWFHFLQLLVRSFWRFQREALLQFPWCSIPIASSEKLFGDQWEALPAFSVTVILQLLDALLASSEQLSQLSVRSLLSIQREGFPAFPVYNEKHFKLSVKRFFGIQREVYPAFSKIFLQPPGSSFSSFQREAFIQLFRLPVRCSSSFQWATFPSLHRKAFPASSEKLSKLPVRRFAQASNEKLS